MTVFSLNVNFGSMTYTTAVQYIHVKKFQNRAYSIVLTHARRKPFAVKMIRGGRAVDWVAEPLFMHHAFQLVYQSISRIEL